MNNVLYHITKEKHLKRIFSEGLLPGKKSRKVGITSSLRNKKWDKIFLTNNVKYIIENQTGYNWMNNGVILEVDVKGLKIEKHEIEGILITQCDGTKNLLSPCNEFVYNGIIPPERLKIIKMDFLIKY